MEVKTRTMGVVNVPENHLLKIPAGLFGFEEYTQFALVDCKTKPFVWLQSTDNSDLAFLLIDP
ncbi:MAG: flagellar assembly protein FliW, partial [Treponema sp.]|nr:flagellar assembly protein FliW [Treponema sp.]